MAFSVHGINLTSLWTSISFGFYNSCAHAPFFNAFPLVFTLHDRHSIVFYDENEHFLNAETTFVLALRSSKFFEVLSKFLLVSFHRYVFATPMNTLVVPAGGSISCVHPPDQSYEFSVATSLFSRTSKSCQCTGFLPVEVCGVGRWSVRG